MGVTVTFIAILELMKEGLIEIVQAEAYAAIHVRTATAARKLTVVEGGVAEADAENEAALAQPELPEEDEDDDEDDLPDLTESAATDNVTEVDEVRHDDAQAAATVEEEPVAGEEVDSAPEQIADGETSAPEGAETQDVDPSAGDDTQER